MFAQVSCGPGTMLVMGEHGNAASIYDLLESCWDQIPQEPHDDGHETRRLVGIGRQFAAFKGEAAVVVTPQAVSGSSGKRFWELAR